MSLEIKHLTKFFDDKCVINDFSYSFPETGIFAIVGESGVGKTTLLRMIAALDNDYTGEINGGGIENVSFAFQEYRLFPQLSALNNVVLSISYRKDKAVYKKAELLLLELGINQDDFDLLPDELSGGMKQRVSIARALMKDSPILLLDEPTKELDEQNAKSLKNVIKKLKDSRLIILVTHNTDDIDDLNAVKIMLG